MWIPYDIRATLKVESGRDGIALSRADDSAREFLVGFYLRNPVTQIWELDLLASGDQPIDAGTMQISLHGNEGGKLAEILCRLTARSAEAALEAAHAEVSRRVLRYLVETGRGMALAGWRIADMTHGARWRCTPFRPSAMQVDFAALGPIDADLAPLARLLARARNAADAESRLLAAFALIHAARDNPALAGARASALRVSQEMLIHSGAINAAEDLLDLDLDGLLAVLRPHHDRLFTADGVLAPVAEDLADQRALSLLANLADLFAHRLLIAELRARKETAAPLRAEA